MRVAALRSFKWGSLLMLILRQLFDIGWEAAIYKTYTSPAGGRLTYQSDRHACICCCHISRSRQRSDISDSHSFARRYRSFKTGSLLILGLALGDRIEDADYKKRAVPMHCSLFVYHDLLSTQGLPWDKQRASFEGAAATRKTVRIAYVGSVHKQHMS